MKKILNKVKHNILLYDSLFIIIYIILNLILYLFNIRFRLWFIILILLIAIIGFILGIIQQIYKITKRKSSTIVISLLCFLPILILIISFLPFIMIIFAFSYQPEHVISLDNKKYVAVVKSFLHVDVDYYDYYGPLLMGTKVRIHGDFGKGGYDPFINKKAVNSVEYIYYDKNGKVKSKKTEVFIKDKDSNIVDSNVYEDDLINKYNDNNEYLLPEEEEVLYEKKFKDYILRFTKFDYALGQKMIVHVLKSTDNGKNFYTVTEEPLGVSYEAKFVFLNENMGFVISNGQINLNNKMGMYVTNDGGKTFKQSLFQYENNGVSFITIEDLPYYDNNILKIKGSVYQIKENGIGYEDKELIFISIDNGLNWYLE